MGDEAPPRHLRLVGAVTHKPLGIVCNDVQSTWNIPQRAGGAGAGERRWSVISWEDGGLVLGGNRQQRSAAAHGRVVVTSVPPAAFRSTSS